MGYVGKILDVNLSSGAVGEISLDDELKKLYLGGKGIAAKLLFENLRPKTEPLSSDNLLIIMTGPLTGTAAPSSGRFCCVSKSPLTGTIFDSHAGGYFGHELKRSGFDGIVFRGRSSSMVFLRIANGKAEILDAEKLRGKSTQETEGWVKKNVDRRCKTLAIGAAGENLVRYASIMHDGHRALGRGGMGAVMGSKNLKAAAVTGESRIPIHDKAKFNELAKGCFELIKKRRSALKEYGTPNVLETVNDVGALPTRNFQTGFFEDADKISGDAVHEHITGSYGCFSCYIKCGKFIEVNGATTKSLEYETLYALGTNCGNSDLASIVRANELCNNLGLDTISTGATIAYFIELAERKIVDYPVKWGDSNAILELVAKIAHREGIGDLLAEGCRTLSQKFGSEFAVCVKGLELPGYDPRAAVGQSLGYATSNEGGSHMRTPAYIDEILTESIDRTKKEGKAQLVKSLQDFHSALDSLILCKFTARTLGGEHYSKLLKYATGIDFDFHKTGERIFNLGRSFNLREGITRKDDALPSRLLNEVMPTGNSKGMKADLSMLGEYYALRGWSSDGVPSKEKLTELQLLR